MGVGLILILKTIGIILIIIGTFKEFNSNFLCLYSREMIILGIIIIGVCSFPDSSIAIEQILKNLTKKI